LINRQEKSLNYNVLTIVKKHCNMEELTLAFLVVVSDSVLLKAGLTTVDNRRIESVFLEVALSLNLG
jgi:hypothetical protein